MTREQLLANHKNYCGRLGRAIEIVHALQYRIEVRNETPTQAEMAAGMFDVLQLLNHEACNELGDLLKHLYNQSMRDRT